MGAWRFGELVVKLDPTAPPDLFIAEAEGLRLLGSHGIPVPEVVAETAGALVLRYLPPGTRNDAALGELFARLHAVRGDTHGTDAPRYLGRTPLQTGTSPRWRDVFVDLRVLPLLDACGPRLGALRARVERLIARVDLPDGPVSLLHGDLWQGNVVHTPTGPALIDPSAQWGHRLYDLAMMDLFGSFHERTWAAYEAAAPLSAAERELIPLHQLPFVLVHLHQFGAGYLESVRRVLSRYDA